MLAAQVIGGDGQVPGLGAPGRAGPPQQPPSQPALVGDDRPPDVVAQRQQLGGASIQAEAGMLRSRSGVAGRSVVWTGVGSTGRSSAGRAGPGMAATVERPGSPEDPDRGHNGQVRVTAKVDYAVRAATMLATCAEDDDGPVKGERIATSQDIPVKYLENILSELRQAGIVRSQRGADGGYWLARPADEITIADVIRAVEGPLAHVRGERAENLEYPEGTGGLQELWVAVRASLRAVLEQATLADVASDDLPKEVKSLTADPDAWQPR